MADASAGAHDAAASVTLQHVGSAAGSLRAGQEPKHHVCAIASGDERALSSRGPRDIADEAPDSPTTRRTRDARLDLDADATGVERSADGQNARDERLLASGGARTWP